MIAEVVPIGIANLQDIPSLLERLAGQIRAGECGDVQRIALVFDGNEIDVRSWGGDGHVLEAIGLLTLGAHRLMAMQP